MRHLDLFSGIGGFAIATEAVWNDVEHIFCDNDPFSQAVLKKHWPNALIYGDIKELSGVGNVDLITGGFPCQPFSSAGQRRGTEDDRHLWPEMLRLIRECRPTYVLGENVSGLLTWSGGLVLDQVISDLEGEGYEVGAFIIPAAGVGAPHKRDRVWIAAHANGRADRGSTRQHARTIRAEGVSQRHEVGKSRKSGTIWDATDSASTNGRGKLRPVSVAHGKKQGSQKQREGEAGQFEGRNLHAPDASRGSGKRRRQDAPGHGGIGRGARRKERGLWSEDWPSAAARLCALDDGLPDGLVRPRGWRNAALKAAGNAIVPQVAARILRAMAGV